jgi:hypothetical protein
MLRCAAALFAARPVRAQVDLQANVPALTGPEADIILPRVAYLFRNGDPRKEALQSWQPSPLSVPLQDCNAAADGQQVTEIMIGGCELDLQGLGRGCG